MKMMKGMDECGTPERKRVQKRATEWLHEKGFRPSRYDGIALPGGSVETFERSQKLYRSWGFNIADFQLMEINKKYYRFLRKHAKKHGCRIIVCGDVLKQEILCGMGFCELDTPNSFQDNQTRRYPNKHQKIVECMVQQVGLIVVYGAQRWSGREETSKYRLLAHQYGYWSKRLHFRGTNEASNMTMLILARKDLCRRDNK